MKIDVMGTHYAIIVKKFDKEPVFKRRSLCGFCDAYKKQIVVCDPATFPGWEKEDAVTVEISRKETLRHEIMHAFLNESGLANSSLQYDAGWAKNEEMIDWFALQSPKIFKAFQEAKAI